MTEETFTVYAYDINTNTLLTEIPHYGLTFGTRMNDNGPIQFSVSLLDPSTQTNMAPILAMGGLPFACYVDLNGSLTWGGLTWTTSYSKKSGQMQFGGNEWLSWGDHRIQARGYDQTVYPDPGVNPVLLIQTILADAQRSTSGPGASVGLQVALKQQTTQPKIIPSYAASQRTVLSQIIQDQCKILNPGTGGIDVTQTTSWDVNGNPTNTLNVWSPRAGRQSSNASAVIDLDSCIDYTWPTNAGNYGTNLIVTGAGTGEKMVAQTVAAQGVPVGGLGQSPKLDKVVSYSQIQTQSQITAMANGAAQQYGQPVVTPSVQIPTAGNLGTFIVGDDVRVISAGDERFPNGLDEYWRVVSYDVSVPDQGVPYMTLTLNPPPQF